MKSDAIAARPLETPATDLNADSLGAALQGCLDQADPWRDYLVLEDSRLTYGMLSDRVRRTAAFIRTIGLATGDRAVIATTDEAATVVIFHALLLMGVTAVIADRQARPEEFQGLVAAADPQVLFTDPERLASLPDGGHSRAIRSVVIAPGLHPRTTSVASYPAVVETVSPLEHFPEVPDETLALLVFTSGTTSHPKGVSLSHGNLAAQLTIFRTVYGFDAHSRILNVLPLHHVDGLIRGPLAALWFGGTVLRPMRFAVEAVNALLDCIAIESVSHFVTVPAMLDIVNRLGDPSRQPFRNAGFRFVICSADYLHSRLWSDFEDRFGVVVVNAYGLSEVVCDALFCGPAADTRLVGSLGKPSGCRARIVDANGRDCADEQIGELLLSGPTVMCGYFRNPQETSRVLSGGWFNTGDLVRRDRQGFYHFEGRKKSVVKSGGVSILPESVSAVVLAMPGVLEAISFGVPDAIRGERLVTCAVAEPGGQLSAEDIATHCRRHLAPSRVPAEIHLVDHLPRSAAGKVMLEAVRAQISRNNQQADAIRDVFGLAADCFKVARDRLSPASTPYNTEGWDSLAHLNFIMKLEESFGIRLSAEEIINLASLADAEEIVARRKA